MNFELSKYKKQNNVEGLMRATNC